MTSEAIAIIGISCRFPMADTKDAFWQLLRDGVDTITPVPTERKGNRFQSAAPHSNKDCADNFHGGFLKEIDRFDPHFFRISSEEATLMDPQQRLLLEASWEALEDAGQVPANLAGSRTGVFVGISRGRYDHLGDNPIAEATDSQNAHYITSQDSSIAANRISFQFNFRGPSIAINTACSSALVAVHQAAQSLTSGESSLAVVGGVNLIFLTDQKATRLNSAGLLSATGRCRSFDAAADGYVPGEGVGVVVLKRFSEAKEDGDRIYAVIRGSAINHNGRGNGLSAPNPRAQKELLLDAYQRAGVSPGRVQYIEAHGSGTPIGDLLELKALSEVLAEDRPPNKRCVIGSVKTNLGNTETASGVAGLIKVALALKHRQIPPHLHFQQPSNDITFDQLPLSVGTQLTSWPLDNQTKAIAGISAFGLGGTNVHLVLENEFEEQKLVLDDSAENQLFLFVLSAKSEQALIELAERYQQFLSESCRSSREVTIANICYTACVKRSHFLYRLAIITRSAKDLCSQLEHLLQTSTSSDHSPKFIHKAKRRKRSAEHRSIQYSQTTHSLSEQELALQTLAQHWLTGGNVNWSQAYSHTPHQFISVPTYPFQRQSYWVESTSSSSNRVEGTANNGIEDAAQPLTNNEKGDCQTLPIPSWSSGTDTVTPRTLTEERLAQIWAEILNLDRERNLPYEERTPVDIHTNFFEMGGHSLALTRLVSQVQKNFWVELPVHSLFQDSTIASLAQRIETYQNNKVHSLNSEESHTKESSWSFIVPMQTSGKKAPVFLFPGGDGSDAELVNLAKLVYHLGTERPIYGVRSQTLSDQQKFYDSTEAMAADYLKEICTLQPKGPYLLVGECLGGVIAFEIAQQLSAQNKPARHLILLDTQVPTEESRQSIRTKRKLSVRGLDHLNKVLKLKPAQLLPYLTDKAKKTTAFLYPSFSDPVARKHYAHVKHIETLYRYRPRDYEGLVTLIISEEVSQRNAIAGWQTILKKRPEIRQVTGDHTSYLGKYVKETAHVLKECLDEL